MAVFSELSSTAASLDAGFDYSSFKGEMNEAAASLRSAAQTVALQSPSYVNGAMSGAQLSWSNGTSLDATFSAASSKGATVSSFELQAADGAWFKGVGKVGVKPVSGDANSVQFSNAALNKLSFGNESAGQIFDGAIKVDMATGNFSGKLKSMTMAWESDNPATAAVESLYVKLSGSIGATGSFNGGLTGLSGKLGGFEWGVMSTAANGVASYQVQGAISGVKIDAGTLMGALDANGFDALMAGLYSGNDTINGTAAADFLEASTGNDKVYGGGGDDHIDGGLGNDQLFGGAGNDTIIGGAGNDKIADDSGDNVIVDLEGNASIVAGAGSDVIATGGGNDKIVAGEGANRVSSGAGNDSVATGSGADWIKGGLGADKILGGGGADVFVFDNMAVGGKDMIGDFNAAEDILAFDTSIFTSLAGGIDAGNVVFGTAAADADDYLIFNAKGGKLYYDADGNGAGGAVEIAGLKGALTGLSASNFADADMLV